MGLSGGGTTTVKNTPDPRLSAAANQFTGTYDAQAPRIQAYADQIGSLIPSILDKYQQGNSGVNAANDWITSTLGSDSAQNPYLDQIIAQTNNDVANTADAKLGTRGLAGGSVAAHILGNELAKNETGLRYTDYNNQQALKAQAAGMAPSNAAADAIQIAPLLSATQTAAGMPLNAATQYAAGMGGLLGQYGTQTKTTPSAGIGGLLGNVLGAWASSGFAIPSDRRLKEDIRRVGQTDAGLPVYTYRYKGETQTHMGVMAQDVEQAQPGALGPELHGFKTVNYAEVR